MSRRPAVLDPSMIREAARTAVATAIEERTIAMTEQEARNTSGGRLMEPEPVLSGAVMEPIGIGF